MSCCLLWPGASRGELPIPAEPCPFHGQCVSLRAHRRVAAATALGWCFRSTRAACATCAIQTSRSAHSQPQPRTTLTLARFATLGLTTCVCLPGSFVHRPKRCEIFSGRTAISSPFAPPSAATPSVWHHPRRHHACHHPLSGTILSGTMLGGTTLGSTTLGGTTLGSTNLGDTTRGAAPPSVAPPSAAPPSAAPPSATPPSARHHP